jgi:hypothetical protein
VSRTIVKSKKEAAADEQRAARAPREWDAFTQFWREHFGDAEPARAHFDIWQASRRRALEQAARLHGRWAAACPSGSGRAYNHVLYGAAIRDLYTDE